MQAWPLEDRLQAYAIAFVAAGAAGFMSSHYLLRVPEPPMRRTGPPPAHRAAARAARRRQLPEGGGLYGCLESRLQRRRALHHQVPHGRSAMSSARSRRPGLAGRSPPRSPWPGGGGCPTGSRTKLFSPSRCPRTASLIALAFIALPERHAFTLPLLFLIQVVMGRLVAASALPRATLALGLRRRGTARRLAAVTLAGSLAAGFAALSGGVLANWFAARELALSFSWTSPGITQQITVLQFRHWEFLFAISFALGFYALHRLSCIQEGEEHSERTVIQHLVIEAFRSIDQLSPIEGSAR